VLLEEDSHVYVGSSFTAWANAVYSNPDTVLLLLRCSWGFLCCLSLGFTLSFTHSVPPMPPEETLSSPLCNFTWELQGPTAVVFVFFFFQTGFLKSLCQNFNLKPSVLIHPLIFLALQHLSRGIGLLVYFLCPAHTGLSTEIALCSFYLFSTD